MQSISRRKFLQWGAAGVPAGALGAWLSIGRAAALRGAQDPRRALLRPPGALDENAFLARCIGCRQCADVCPNNCIRFESGGASAGSPYLRAREKACILCMRCTQVCPTGALRAVPTDSGEDIQAHVRMGTAVIDKNICNSYNGYACGACAQACPFQGQALRVLTWERPVVDPEFCVGCGLCEKACIVYPQAIRVRPRSVSG